MIAILCVHCFNELGQPRSVILFFESECNALAVQCKMQFREAYALTSQPACAPLLDDSD